jgi:deoxyhypusine synthase
MPGMTRYAYQPLDSSKIRSRSIQGRATKVSVEQFGKVYQKDSGLNGWVQSLPKILAGSDFRRVIGAIVAARALKKPIIWGLGAHVIKCGLNPALVDLMEQGFVTALALNGAGAIHDFEIALAGSTSEDVESELETGDFGMSRETAEWMNEAIAQGVSRGIGLGEAIGTYLGENSSRFPFVKVSLLAAAFQHNIPVTVHVAIGTDTIHIHPSADGSLLGKGSLQDFRLLTSVVRDLNDGGVYLNCGSAVILPEVFLKAVSLVRNLGSPLGKFTTVNLDFLQHYRPHHNVVKRPTRGSGQGIELIGHHELMIPLLAAALIESKS